MLAFTRCDYDTADAQSMQSPGRQSRPPALSASLADGAFAAYECFALVQNLGAGRIYFARALQSKRVKPPNRRWNPKTALLGRAAFAACERFALGQNPGAGRIHFARALQSKWVKPPDGRRNPQKRTSRRMSFFVEHPNTTIDAAASGLQSNQTEAQRSGFGLERRSDGMSER